MASNLTALLEGPAATPPPGVIPQLDNPPNRKTATQVLPSIAMALATIAVAMSMYSRVFISREFGLPDCEYFVLADFQLRSRFVLIVVIGRFNTHWFRTKIQLILSASQLKLVSLHLLHFAQCVCSLVKLRRECTRGMSG